MCSLTYQWFCLLFCISFSLISATCRNQDFSHVLSSMKTWGCSQNISIPILINSNFINLDCSLWLQSNPSIKLLLWQRGWNKLWICGSIFHAYFWGYPSCSLTDTQLPQYSVVVNCSSNYVLSLCFHRNVAFYWTNQGYVHQYLTIGVPP